MKQGEAVGRRIMARGEPEKSSHVVGDLCELRRGGVRDGVGNVTSPVLSYGKEMDVRVENVMVELWVR